MMVELLIDFIKMINGGYVFNATFINALTGIVVAMILLSMRNFKYTPSAALRYSTVLFQSACTTLLLAILVNKINQYPSFYPPSAMLYVVSYMLFFGYVLYASSKYAQRSVNANKTICSAKNAKPLN